MTYVKLTNVRTFPNAAPTKAQALKVLEEAAEVFGAWQQLDGASRVFTDVDECSAMTMASLKYDLLDEIADTIQACCNLAASLGVTDMTAYLACCEERNRERGRYDAL